MTALIDYNYDYMPIRDYSLGLGESLTKVGRHKLALLCLEGIRLELSRKPIPNKPMGRGRPLSPVGILAQRMEVHPDSVRRWMDLSKIQASNHNSEKLALFAYELNPGRTIEILRTDIELHRTTVETWISQMLTLAETASPNNAVSPYAENIEVKETN